MVHTAQNRDYSVTSLQERSKDCGLSVTGYLSTLYRLGNDTTVSAAGYVLAALSLLLASRGIRLAASATPFKTSQSYSHKQGPSMRFRVSLLCTLLFSLTNHAMAQQVSVVARPDTPIQSRYIEFLKQQLTQKKGRVIAGITEVARSRVIVGTERQMPGLLNSTELRAWRRSKHSKGSEGYSVTPITHGTQRTLVLSASGERGELFAIGWLLRSVGHCEGGWTIPHPKAFTTQPDRKVRGYQIGYRMKNNTYDAWTLDQFRQQMLDMAVFGLNTMQVVAPISDDDLASPLFPAPAEETVIGLSRMSKEYGLRFDLFYPEMAKDYTDPEQVKIELEQFENLVRKLPLVDSVHIPGGDPGHAAPEVLMPLIRKQSAILHRYHPNAEVWVSAQGFTADRYKRFYEILRSRPAFLNGVFFGPQSRESLEQQREKISTAYPIEFYPDTAHAMHSQFPVPQWDPVFALTEGREPIDPRPAAFEHIYKHFYPYTSGFIVYSEGVNDDINKVLWGGWGWDVRRPTHSTLKDYARYFFHAEAGDDDRIATAIEALEQNWTGPLLRNRGIAATLTQLEGLHPADARQNWRWDSLLYRGTYDRFLQVKRGREAAAEQSALLALDEESLSAPKRLAHARQALQDTAPNAEERRLHDYLLQLAATLFRECGLQLSVKLYGASTWERGANLDRIDTPLNDRTWIEVELERAEALQGKEQLQKLSEIAHWASPVPGALYDDLGDPTNEPHLVRGRGWNDDPELYRSAIDGIADETLAKAWRLSWLDYAETLYEHPLQLHYAALQTGYGYKVRITYSGEAYKLPMELKANGTMLHGFRLRASNPEQVEFEIRPDLVNNGELTLEWSRPYGAGGGGRGGQVSEVWLLPVHSDL